MKKLILILLIAFSLQTFGQGNFFWSHNDNLGCPNIGDSYGGGIVAYLFGSADAGYVSGECHGIIVANTDQSTGATWYNGSNIEVFFTTANIGEGQYNTSYIYNAQGAGTYAATLCLDYSNGGFSDWFLPSYGDVTKFNALLLLGIGGFVSGDLYWTSTEGDATRAYLKDIYLPGTAYLFAKSSSAKVRAARYF